MAALVTARLGNWKKNFGVVYAGPTKVASADETDLSTPNTSISFDTVGIRKLTLQVIFANYTSVAVKLQRSLDGGATWDDLTTALSTTGDSVDVSPESPSVRLSIAGTLSGAADTMSVYLYAERQAV